MEEPRVRSVDRAERDEPRITRDDPPRRREGGRDVPSPPPTRAAVVVASAVSSCESVLAGASEEMDLTADRGAPDLSRGAYANVLERGGYLGSCAVPDHVALDICAAIKGGRAVGVTVVTRPSDARVEACVRSAVAALSFPSSARLDVTRTRFEAVTRR